MTWEEGRLANNDKEINVNDEMLKIKGYLDEPDAKILLHNFLRDMQMNIPTHLKQILKRTLTKVVKRGC